MNASVPSLHISFSSTFSSPASVPQLLTRDSGSFSSWSDNGGLNQTKGSNERPNGTKWSNRLRWDIPKKATSGRSSLCYRRLLHWDQIDFYKFSTLSSCPAKQMRSIWLFHQRCVTDEVPLGHTTLCVLEMEIDLQGENTSSIGPSE